MLLLSSVWKAATLLICLLAYNVWVFRAKQQHCGTYRNLKKTHTYKGCFRKNIYCTAEVLFGIFKIFQNLKKKIGGLTTRTFIQGCIFVLFRYIIASINIFLKITFNYVLKWKFSTCIQCCIFSLFCFIIPSISSFYEKCFSSMLQN